MPFLLGRRVPFARPPDRRRLPCCTPQRRMQPLGLGVLFGLPRVVLRTPSMTALCSPLSTGTIAPAREHGRYGHFSERVDAEIAADLSDRTVLGECRIETFDELIQSAFLVTLDPLRGTGD